MTRREPQLYQRGPLPVINQAEVCKRAVSVARELGFSVEVNPPSMIAEDFSRYLKLAPGALDCDSIPFGQNKKATER